MRLLYKFPRSAGVTHSYRTARILIVTLSFLLRQIFVFRRTPLILVCLVHAFLD